jgi:phage gp36-like protein
MAYATPEDLSVRFHLPLLEDLASDTGSPAAGLANNPRVLAALEDASGRIDAALLVGGRYQPGDLEGLAGHSQAHLKRITCALAVGYLVQNRVARLDEGTKAMIEQAEQVLDLLRKGLNVFNLPQHQEAGRSVVDGPTVAERIALNTLPVRVRHFYPRDSGRLPLGR